MKWFLEAYTLNSEEFIAEQEVLKKQAEKER